MRSNMSGNPSRSPSDGQELGAARLDPERRAAGRAASRRDRTLPHTHGHQVAPVVEMEVRDRDRVDVRPRPHVHAADPRTPGPQSSRMRLPSDWSM